MFYYIHKFVKVIHGQLAASLQISVNGDDSVSHCVWSLFVNCTDKSQSIWIVHVFGTY